MLRRRHLRGVIDNTLSSLASRYSDYQGYWMLGFLALDTEPVAVRLTEVSSDARGAFGTAFARRAVRVFWDQVRKAGFPASVVQDAVLRVQTSADVEIRLLDGRTRPARKLTFHIQVTTDLESVFAREQVHWAGPHDPALEMCSGRSGTGPA